MKFQREREMKTTVMDREVEKLLHSQNKIYLDRYIDKAFRHLALFTLAHKSPIQSLALWVK